MTVYAPELTEIATRLKAYAFLSFFFFVSILSYFCSILLLLLSFFFWKGECNVVRRLYVRAT